MGRSAGPGSPVWFRCWSDRSTVRGGVDHRVTLTGRRRPYRSAKGHALGIRSDTIAREYRCTCGHVGWSNHLDLSDIDPEGAGRDELRGAQ